MIRAAGKPSSASGQYYIQVPTNTLLRKENQHLYSDPPRNHPHRNGEFHPITTKGLMFQSNLIRHTGHIHQRLHVSNHSALAAVRLKF